MLLQTSKHMFKKSVKHNMTSECWSSVARWLFLTQYNHLTNIMYSQALSMLSSKRKRKSMDLYFLLFIMSPCKCYDLIVAIATDNIKKLKTFATLMTSSDRNIFRG